MRLIERIRQKSEGQRRFLMFLSMAVFSFLILAIAWKSFKQNLGIRLDGVSEKNAATTETPSPLQSLIEDIKRIAGGERLLSQEANDAKQETGNGWIEWVFSVARETRRVVKYNAGEIWRWSNEVVTNYLHPNSE